jgi:hypothetical protein
LSASPWGGVPGGACAKAGTPSIIATAAASHPETADLDETDPDMDALPNFFA